MVLENAIISECSQEFMEGLPIICYGCVNIYSHSSDECFYARPIPANARARSVRHSGS